jgi:hypothetical protein
MMSGTVRWGAMLFAVVLLLTANQPASATSCLDTRNSHLAEEDGESFCGGTGGGCSSCFTRDPRGDGSWDLCYYDWSSGDLVCTYYL